MTVSSILYHVLATSCGSGPSSRINVSVGWISTVCISKSSAAVVVAQYAISVASHASCTVVVMTKNAIASAVHVCIGTVLVAQNTIAIPVHHSTLVTEHTSAATATKTRATHHTSVHSTSIVGCAGELLTTAVSPATLAGDRKIMRGKFLHGLIVEEGATVGSGEEWAAVEEGGGAGEKKVVEAEVGDGGEGLAEGDDGGANSNDGSCKDVVPIVDWKRARKSGNIEINWANTYIRR